MSSVTLIVAPLKEKDSVRLVVQRSVQTVWSFLTDHLSSHRGKNIWAKAQEDSTHVTAKEQEDPSTRGYPGEERAKKKANLPSTSKQSSQGWASGGIVTVLCALKRLMSKGMWASGMRQTMPGSLDRDFYYKKSANRPTSQSQTSKSPSSNRNAITSSYSSTLGLLPQRKVARAARFPRPGAANGAAPRLSNDVPSSGASKADPGASKGAVPGAAKATAPPSSSDDPSLGASKSADQGDAAGSAPRAAPGVAGDADTLPHLASSQCQVRAKKPSESCQQTSSSPSGKGKGRKIKKINKKLPRQVQGQDDPLGQQKSKRPCETSSHLPSPKRRKIVLLLPCRRDRPLVMPPAPDPGFPVTVEFYDAEKRAAMERLNKFLMVTALRPRAIK
uniref:nuclear envelope pore membrane protein POM 121C-like n=1 Tax=Jaculus jaculus TaxID=51337 RepID=UPI001E1B37B7|nr:nuclear envelope pore membrane protein POM 121C-like [Jaculus jaculus]